MESSAAVSGVSTSFVVLESDTSIPSLKLGLLTRRSMLLRGRVRRSLLLLLLVVTVVESGRRRMEELMRLEAGVRNPWMLRKRETGKQ